MSKVEFFFKTDQYGYYVLQSGSFFGWDNNNNNKLHTKRKQYVSNTKQIVRAMMSEETSTDLFNAAWKNGLRTSSIEPSKNITVDDSPTTLLKDAYETYRDLDLIISSMVNNPKSKYYIHG